MGLPETNLAGGSDTEANLTIAAMSSGAPIELEDISFSYSQAPATPSSPNLIVESPAGTPIFQAFVTDAGPGQIRWNSCLKGVGGANVKVRLLADSGGAIGAVNATVRG